MPMTNSEGGKRTSSELKFVKRRNSLNPDYSSIQPPDNSLLKDQYLRVNKNRKHSYDLSNGRALQRQKTGIEKNRSNKQWTRR